MSGSVAVLVEDARWREAVPEVERLCRRFAEAALTGAARPGALCIALADDGAARDLNRRFRGIDKPTNVLSFPASDEAPDDEALGDILIAFETSAREAKADRVALADHLAHLVVHGALHLRGYDHERATDAEIMETIETELLARLGVADPYASPAGRSPR